MLDFYFFLIYSLLHVCTMGRTPTPTNEIKQNAPLQDLKAVFTDNITMLKVEKSLNIPFMYEGNRGGGVCVCAPGRYHLREGSAGGGGVPFLPLCLPALPPFPPPSAENCVEQPHPGPCPAGHGPTWHHVGRWNEA